MKTGAGKIYALIALMVLLWSGNYIVAKVALREIPPVLLMSLRMALSGAIMLPFLWQELGRRTLPVTGRDMVMWTLLGVGGVMANQFFFVLGISQTTVTHSSMLVATTPVWVLLIAALLRMESVTVPKIAGMGMAILGVAVLQLFRPKLSPHGPSVAGDLITLLAAFLFAMMTVFRKRAKADASSIIVISIGYIGGAIVLAPLGWSASRSFDLSRVSWAAWWSLAYMAAFSSVLCYLIYYWVLERLAASRIATFQYLQPFLAMVMAVFLLGEELTLPAIASGGIIFAGVFLTERFG